MKPMHQTPEKFDEICEWSPMPPKLIGEKVFLTAFDNACTEDFLRFFTDETTAQGMGSSLYRTITHDEEYGIMSSMGCNTDKGFNFMIWDIAEQCVIGSCCLNNVEMIHRTAELGISIGSRKHRNGGRGKDAIKLMLKFAFEELDLHEICLNVFDFNKNAIACYKKCGFKEYGRRRQSRYIHGQRHDEILMDILREEYETNKTTGKQ